MKKFYICGVKSKGEGIYSLLTEDGEFLASHLCSSAGYALGDLTNREERKKDWKEKFGEYEVLWLGDDELTKEEMQKRNKEWFEKTENADKIVKEGSPSMVLEVSE